MKLIVLGAGKILEKILEKLIKNINFNIVAVGVDKSNFKSGMDIVKISEQYNIPFINNLNELGKYDFDYVFMLSYPPLITNEYLEKYRFINTHYAPLPKYRGFHGLVWSIINGEEKTGYTIHKVEDGIDNGAIYYQYLLKIEIEDNVNTLINKIEYNLLENIEKILIHIYNGLEPKPQDVNNATYVCRRKQEDGMINWNDKAINIFNLIRALTPPYTKGAFTHKGDETIYIKEAELFPTPTYISICGQVVQKLKNKGVLVKCGDGVILVKKIIINDIEIDPYNYFKTVGTRLK
jgi:methionyl-tRNA formyltransferase